MTRIGLLLLAGALALVPFGAPAAADDRADATTYVLDLEGPDVVVAGAEVTISLTATDQDGSPVVGLFVRFVRTGPGPERWESCSVEQVAECGVTGGGGASASIGVGHVPGVIEVRAQVYGADGALLAEAGPEQVTVHLTSCPSLRAKCTPPRAMLTGASERGRDLLTVNASSVRRGDRVVLMRRHRGQTFAIGRVQRLDRDGDCRFSVRDRNGRAVTRYVAVVLARSGRTDGTPAVRLR